VGDNISSPNPLQRGIIKSFNKPAYRRQAQDDKHFIFHSLFLILHFVTMLYENESKLTARTLDIRRAIDSIREELEAVDLYNQRADATSDPELKQILLHNANEEKEHASMLLEWLRRNDANMDHELRDNLFKDGAITGQH